MPKSVLEAIKLGLWDFEPADVPAAEYDRTDAMPGTKPGQLMAMVSGKPRYG